MSDIIDERKQKRSSEMRENRRVRNLDNYSKDNKISWGSIIAGGISFAAVFTVLSLLIGAFGLGIFSPNNENPFNSMGTGVAVATIVVLIVSFCVSGFIAGAFSKGQSSLHGFMSWALSILLLFALVINMISGVLGVADSAFEKTFDTAGNVAGSVASTTAKGAGNSLSSVADSISEVDTQELQSDIEGTLSETDVKELQPDYLKNELDQSKDEITEAGKEILVNPDNSDKIIQDLSHSLGKKAKNIRDSVDKDTIKEEVYKNSDLSAKESEEAVDNIYNGLDKASNKASDQIENAKNNLEDAKKDAKDKTDKATDKASTGTILVFVFLILGLLIESYAARKGEEYVNKY